MSRTRTLPAAIVAGLLALTACSSKGTPAATSAVPAPSGSAGASGSSAPSADATAGETPEPATSTTPPPVALRDVVVYFVGDTSNGPRLYREVHKHAFSKAVVMTAANGALRDRPFDTDYQNVWPKGTTVLGVSIAGKVATVDLSKEVRAGNVGSSYEAAALDALVYTVRAAAPDLTGVHLRVEGKEVASLWGHVDTSGTLTPSKAEEIIAPVQITSIRNLATLHSPVTIKGEATVFEATVSWQVLQGYKVVKEGAATATKGAPQRGTWSFSADLPKGTYTVKAFESSAKDGSETFVDTKTITVS